MINYTLSKFKVIAAISVVLIHSTYFIYADGEASFFNYYWYRPLLNFAVPFFFAASGYLLSFKSIEYFKPYLKKILSMYALYTLLYLIFDAVRTIGSQMVQGSNVIDSVKVFLSTRSIYHIINGTLGHSHLWYLWALWLSGIILYLFLNYKVDIKLILAISITAYIITAFMRGTPVVEEILKEGSFFEGLAFLAIGYFVGKEKPQFYRPLRKSLLALLFYTIFYQFTGISGLVDLILIISTWYLIIFIANNPGNPSKLSRLDKFSTDIYLNHMFVITGYAVISSVIPSLVISSAVLRVFVVTMFSVGISIIMSKPLKKIYLEPLSKIF